MVSHPSKMALKMLITLFIMWFKESYSIESTPVLIWTLNSSHNLPGDVRPLLALQPNKFEMILTKLIQQQFHLAVFVEEFLDVEDLSAKDANGDKLFLHTQRIYGNHSIVYFPLVHKPSIALKAVSQKYSTHEFFVVSSVNNEWKNLVVQKIAKGDNKVTVTYLEKESAPQSRATLLKNHDKFINDVCNVVQHIRNIMCIYMGLHPFKADEMTTERQWEMDILHLRYRRSRDDERSLLELLKDPNFNISGGNRSALDTENLSIKLSSFDEALPREEVIVQGHKGSCERDCLFEAESPDAAVSVHLATAPTLWYNNREITLQDFETSMIIIDDSNVALKVETPEATLYFHFVVFSGNNWVLTGVNLAINGNQMRQEDEDENPEDKSLETPDDMFLASDFPIIGRKARQFHCPLNSFSGKNSTGNKTRSAILYLYKMTINMRLSSDLDDWSQRKVHGNATGNASNSTGVDYCIPFANAAMLTAFCIVGTMVILAMSGVAMLMTAKAYDKWDSAEQRVLLREA